MKKFKKGSKEAKEFMAKIRAKRKYSTVNKKQPESVHKDTKSHNVNISVLSGMKGLKKITGVAPHKAKYFIDFMLNGVERTEYFDKIPKGVYKGENKVLYLMRFTDSGTSLIPLLSTKDNKPVKR